MTKSTPDDLAVTFRSLARREAEAIGEADVTIEVEAALDELRGLIASAAAQLGVPANAAAVAGAIEARPADVWTVEALDALREVALDVGRALRRLASITRAEETADDE